MRCGRVLPPRKQEGEPRRLPRHRPLRPVAAHLDHEPIPRPPVTKDPAVRIEHVGHVQSERAGLRLKPFDGGDVGDEEPEVESFGVRRVVLASLLENEREPFAVGQDCDRGGTAVRLAAQAEQLLEEGDGARDVGDLEVEVIDLHGEPFRAQDALCAVGPHRIFECAGIKGS